MILRWILPTGFNGSTLAEELMVKPKDGLYAGVRTKFQFNIAYNYVENQLNIEIIDLRGAGDRYSGHAAEVILLSYEDLYYNNGLKKIEEYLNTNMILKLDNSKKYRNGKKNII